MKSFRTLRIYMDSSLKRIYTSTMTPPVAGCDGTGPLIIVNQSSGYIESPGYPRHYGNGLFCEWVIKVEEGNRINITFLDFDLEDGYEYVP